MEHINEITGEITNIVKRTYEQANETSTRFTTEATKAMENGFGQTRELVELGLRTQKAMWGEWMKTSETAKNMWDDMVHSYTKAYETKAPLKAAK
jgi:prophage DNA circulation protein